MILFLSRDSRVHSLFRTSWEKTLSLNNYEYTTLFTNRGIILKFFTICNNYSELYNSNKIIIFGIQDVLLYRFLYLPKTNKYFVVTGFGRLWLNKFTRIILIFFFKTIFKNESVAVLNHDDYNLLNNFGLNKLFHLHGEGHPILDSNVVQKNIHQQTSKNVLEFVYVGRLLKSKGILETVEFLKNFSQSLKTNISFTILGDYDYNNKDSVSESDIVQLNQHGIKFNILGYSDQPWDLICPNSIFISLSHREGLPFSVLEALHHNHYCILSSVPGHNEFKNFSGLSILSDDFSFNLLHKDIIDWMSKSCSMKCSLRREKLFLYSLKNTITEKISFLELKSII